MGTTPNSGEVGVVLGAPNTGVLQRLNAEARNCTWCFSCTRKLRVTVALNCGAVSRRILELRNFVVRSVSGSRCAHNCGDVLNHRLIYAWNENDEGGWLTPTLYDGNARLEAVRRVLKAEHE